jgi:hypothetical protein
MSASCFSLSILIAVDGNKKRSREKRKVNRKSLCIIAAVFEWGGVGVGDDRK